MVHPTALAAVFCLALPLAARAQAAPDASEWTRAALAIRPIKDPDPAPPDAASAGPTRWYGWQIAAIDLASLAITGAGVAPSTSGTAIVPFIVLGGSGYLFGGPIVHAAHGRGWTAFRSLGLRIGLPVLGGALGLAAACASGCSGGDGSGAIASIIGAGVGSGVGALIAAIIDSAALAYEPINAPPAGAAPARVALGPGRGGLQLVGTF